MIDPRCDVCGRLMVHVRRSWPIPWAFSWRCPDEGFLRHFEKERAAR